MHVSFKTGPSRLLLVSTITDLLVNGSKVTGNWVIILLNANLIFQYSLVIYGNPINISLFFMHLLLFTYFNKQEAIDLLPLIPWNINSSRFSLSN